MNSHVVINNVKNLREMKMNIRIIGVIEALFLLLDEEILIRNTEHDGNLIRFMEDSRKVNDLLQRAHEIKREHGND
jgi:hypothetical protein